MSSFGGARKLYSGIDERDPGQRSPNHGINMGSYDLQKPNTYKAFLERFYDGGN